LSEFSAHGFEGGLSCLELVCLALEALLKVSDLGAAGERGVESLLHVSQLLARGVELSLESRLGVMRGGAELAAQ
jgi:hypothetical protein